MASVASLARPLQHLFTTVANDAARHGGCRQGGKFSGATLAQTLVFGYLANPDATLTDLVATAGSVVVAISPQGIDARFNERTAALLEQLVQAATAAVVAADPAAVPLFQRFPGGVY